MEYTQDRFTISTDKTKLQIEVIYQYLHEESYWAKDRPLDVIKKGIENSLCFGLYEGDKQIGLARIITDYSTMAYLCDLFVLVPYRGLGLGKWLVETVVSYPDLQRVRSIMLATTDAHGLYRKYGFAPPRNPETLMSLVRPNPYQ